MTIFGFDGAWSLGFRAVAGRFAGQAVIIVGVGIVAPLLLRLVLPGVTTGSTPVSAVFAGPSSAGAGGLALIAALIGYVLQTGSYFASWRYALAGDESVGGALGYGLLAGLVALLAVALAGAVLGFGVVWLRAIPGVAIVVGLILIVPLLMLFAIFYTALTAAFALILGLALAITMILGVALGNAGFAATLLGGGSGLVVVMLLVACALALWIAARLSCASSIMAESRSFNLIEAARASWALTIDDQGRIMGYLALIGIGFAVILFALAAAIGMSIAGFGAVSIDPRGAVLAASLIGLIAGVPVAVLSVAVPAGIYRALNRSSEAALVFA